MLHDRVLKSRLKNKGGKSRLALSLFLLREKKKKSRWEDGMPFCLLLNKEEKKKKNQFQRYVANNGQEETWFIWLFFCRCCACFTRREKEIAITKENRSHCLAALFEKKKTSGGICH